MDIGTSDPSDPAGRVAASPRLPRLAIALALGAAAAACLALASCAPSNEGAPHRIAEAYRLMDQSQNAKAVLVLQDALELDPSSDEARVLLASAYMGLAGVDIYSIWDNFHDVLFNRSLGDMFLKAGSDPAIKGPPPAPAVTGDPSLPAKSMVERLDRFMAEMRNIVAFLNRFPAIPRDKWVLLTQAMSQLERVEQKKDVTLYRLFIRMVHLRAWMNEEVLSNPKFGTREWACSIETAALKEQVGWIAGELDVALSEYRFVFPDKATGLTGFAGVVNGLKEGLQRSEEGQPAGGGTAILSGEKSVRKAFGCDTIAGE